jgi:hypothetical protein
MKHEEIENEAIMSVIMLKIYDTVDIDSIDMKLKEFTNRLTDGLHLTVAVFEIMTNDYEEHSDI